MASIWWVVVAFFAGGFSGAILVALMSINAQEDEVVRRPLESTEDTHAAAVG